MRRWVLWIASSTLLLVVGLALVALTPEPAPFQFVKGRQAIELPPTMKKSYMVVGSTYYHFKADYLTMRKVMADELQGKGFEVLPHGNFESPEAAVLFRRKEGAVASQEVWMFRDSEYSLTAFDFPSERHRPGWVAIRIIAKREPTFLTRLRDFFGL